MQAIADSLDRPAKSADIEWAYSMRNARHIIAVTLMATAICADRVAPAVPTEQPTVHLAGRFMARLSANFRRVLPSARLYQPHRGQFRMLDSRPSGFIDQSAGLMPVCLSPFQFRLPPPIV